MISSRSLLTPEQRDAQLAAAREAAANGTSFSAAFGFDGAGGSGKGGVGSAGASLSVGSVGSAGGSSPAAISAALALLRAPAPQRETKWDRNPEWVRPTYRLFAFGADAPPPGGAVTQPQSVDPNAPTMIERAAIPAALRYRGQMRADNRCGIGIQFSPKKQNQNL